MKDFKGNKSCLPSKICVTCQRPFSWRKKWEKVWEDVKYCSERCRKQLKASSTQPQAMRR
ncbi:DUF2256 domain-containing protein [Sediminibacterium sp. KACHI17]|uniref:DUF2256 domain-containing protein n=1 Tax=Sediminibacterium sp. KACHI17 TaxID=1751071 RepID=UPI0033658190